MYKRVTTYKLGKLFLLQLTTCQITNLNIFLRYGRCFGNSQAKLRAQRLSVQTGAGESYRPDHRTHQSVPSVKMAAPLRYPVQRARAVLQEREVRPAERRVLTPRIQQVSRHVGLRLVCSDKCLLSATTEH